MLKVGLYFGSFNPVHVGHLSIANYIWQNEDVDEVWMIISPQNPFKEKKSLWDQEVRLQLLQSALSGHPRIRVSTIEFDMPRPSYTYYTIKELKAKFPDHSFSMIIGEDNIEGLPNWKKGEELIQENFFYIYPRNTENSTEINLPQYKKLNAPMLDISSTMIRKALKEGKDIRFLVGKDVAQLITELKPF